MGHESDFSGMFGILSIAESRRSSSSQNFKMHDITLLYRVITKFESSYIWGISRERLISYTRSRVSSPSPHPELAGNI